VCLLRFLPGEFGFEGLLALGDVALIAGGVNEGIGKGVWVSGLLAGGHAGELGQHVEVDAVRAEEDVAGKGFEGAEALLEVGGHLRILGVVDEVVAGVDVGAADDDCVQALAVFLHG
jgi:hypothetical protein